MRPWRLSSLRRHRTGVGDALGQGRRALLDRVREVLAHDLDRWKGEGQVSSEGRAPSHQPPPYNQCWPPVYGDEPLDPTPGEHPEWVLYGNSGEVTTLQCKRCGLLRQPVIP